MHCLRIITFAVTLIAVTGVQSKDVRVELRLKRIHNEEVLQQEFLDRATPGSTKYMQHLSVKELTELHRPVEGAQAAVKSFLSDLASDGTGRADFFVTQDAMMMAVDVGSLAADRLGVRDAQISGAMRVPSVLKGYVEQMYLWPDVKPQRMRPGYTSPQSIVPSYAGVNQNPFTLMARYTIPNTSVSSAVVQAVAEFEDGFSQRALDTFNRYFGLQQQPDVRMVGPSDSSSPSYGQSEGQLDVEYITAMAPNATTYWIGGNNTPTDWPWWTKWCDEVLRLDPLPQVISSSWFVQERYLQYSQSDSTTPTLGTAPMTTMPPAMAAAEDAFRKLSLAGITVLVASGDWGPGQWDSECEYFNPLYPVTSHYTTAVGATYANSSTGPEGSVTWSGGGFSWFNRRPTWQNSSVLRYLNDVNKSLMPPASMYNSAGRGYPDVAALGTNYAVAGTSPFSTGVSWENVAGTSAAAPAFAGILSRVVGERLKKGKGSLGCINPTIYHLGKVGQDITVGKTANGCTSSFEPTGGWTGGHGVGFSTAVGWDPATGLGTPDYEHLLAHLG